jgi:hypothetical protein
MMRSSAAVVREELQAFLDTQFSSLPPPQVMDVGCGGAMRIRFPAGAVFNGIDISAESAARNATISSIIIGDIQLMTWWCAGSSWNMCAIRWRPFRT